MLTRLSIRDIVLIDRLDIEFASGLSVLTGETGAGKSILLDAFALALGARGDSGLVRQGLEHGQVTAVFELPGTHPARDILSGQDIAIDDELILRRIQLNDGRTRAFVNDQPVSVQALRSIGRALVEIHGQHDERALVDIAAHRHLLDAYHGLGPAVTELRSVWKDWRAAREALDAHASRVDQARREADWLRHAVDELKALAPTPGEETALAVRRAAMQQTEKLAQDLGDAHEQLSGSHSPIPTLSACVRRLERRLGQARPIIEPLIRSLDAALAALEEARGTMAAAVQVAAHDPQELERIEERLFGLRAAGRKYNVAINDLADLAERYSGDLATLHAGAEELAGLAAQARSLEERYREAATALSRRRARAAAALEAAVNGELPPLRLERARFGVEMVSDADAAGPDGIDRVEFLVQTNPGTRPGPLMKVASGGELARFLLAIKVVLADRGSAPTLVFDEVDTGVGGAVAHAIGLRLSRLGARVQVLAVTHAPQVAARAARHYLISKTALDRGERVTTRINEVADRRRRDEIARMLAGADITKEARAAAEQLIRAAG